jgi:hypothetical protein
VEPAQWFQLSGAVVGLLALVVSAYKALNSKSAAYEQATGSLGLVKALDDVDLSDDDLQRIEERKALREGLLDRAYFYSQLYSSATEPVLGTHWQTEVFFVLGVSAFISQAISPLTGSLDDVVSRVALVAVPLIFFGAGYLLSFRVSRNKAVLKNLREPARLFYPRDAAPEDGRFGKLHEVLVRANEGNREAASKPAGAEDGEMSVK